MKIAVKIAMATLIGMSAQAEQRVTVYVQDGMVVPLKTLAQAERLAADMFATAGVRIEWRNGHPREAAITVSLAETTPKDYLPGALAFARAYEGVHITVFYDRVLATAPREVTPALLAHVLAHEITHILQGCDQHSESGIMKARWTKNDIDQMAFKALPFTSEDVDMIHIGLAAQDHRGSPTVAMALDSTSKGVDVSELY
jgi:hypothetical protein